MKAHGLTARLTAVTAVLVLLAAWTHGRPRGAGASAIDLESAVPLTLGGWIGRAAPALDPEVARVLAADQYVHRFYGPRTTDYEPRIEVDVAYYARPQAGAAMHSPLNCLPGNGWQVVDSRTIPVRSREAVNVRRLVVARGGHRVAMTYWFQNRGAVVANEYRQRFQLLTSGLKGLPTDAALVRVMTPDDAPGHEALLRFTPALLSVLKRAFAP